MRLLISHPMQINFLPWLSPSNLSSPAVPHAFRWAEIASLQESLQVQRVFVSARTQTQTHKHTKREVKRGLFFDSLLRFFSYSMSVLHSCYSCNPLQCYILLHVTHVTLMLQPCPVVPQLNKKLSSMTVADNITFVHI